MLRLSIVLHDGLAAPKADKISNNKREKAKNVILKTLELEKGDSFIVLSNVTREGKDTKILNEIESLIEEEETL